MRKSIAVVTSTRADYGIWRPLLRRLDGEESMELRLVVTGTHLLERHGRTEREIEKDGFPIHRRIGILGEGDSPYDVSIAMANAVRGFAEYFREERPDLLLVLGDRTEILGVCCAAMNERIPIGHLHGGELTQGAVDDCVRHAITKMSYLHFAATEEYRERIIQMGEDPGRVFDVGALGVESILTEPLLSYEETCEQAGIPLGREYAVVTFHPVTLEDGTQGRQARELTRAMEERGQYFYLITRPNADAGGEEVNAVLEEFARGRENARMTASLGSLRYLSAMRHSRFVLGNSSSGILEAPALGVPTVNIGDRQKGRKMACTVLCCGPRAEEIVRAMDEAGRMPRVASTDYGDGHTSERIMEILKDFLGNGKIDLKKGFHDIRNKKVDLKKGFHDIRNEKVDLKEEFHDMRGE